MSSIFRNEANQNSYSERSVYSSYADRNARMKSMIRSSADMPVAGAEHRDMAGKIRSQYPAGYMRKDSDDFSTCGDCECHIIGVCRFGHDYFVAGVETCHKCEEHRLRTTGGDNDVVDAYRDIKTGIILLQFSAKRQHTF